MTTTELYKNELFQDADFFQINARECYEMAEALEAENKVLADGWRENARDYENRFNQMLDFLMNLGWDKEYMGIA